ncbi:MAG TPA: hypothetical protein VF588_07910 [Pyrinomonadaceae bacterium]
MHSSRLGAFIKPWAALAAVCLLLVVAAAPSRANMAARQPESRAGDAPTEPGGALKSVRILRETLVIDLRPLAGRRPAVVEATYAVYNDAGEHGLDLVFVAASMRPGAAWVWNGYEWKPGPERAGSEGGVWLDGRAVEARAEEDARGLPAAWAPPATTPGLRPGQKPLPLKSDGKGTLSFRVTLSSGPHELRVRYEARPGAYADAMSDAVYWQLGYVLAPARQWAGFGGLDAKVLLPEGWRAASLPEMRREGDALVASWDALPADTLAVTVQTNESTVHDPGVFWKALLVLGLLLTAAATFAGWRLGRWLGRRGRTSAWGLLASPLVAVLLFALSYPIASAISAPRAPGQAAFNQIGNYDGIVTFLLFVVITFWHFLVAQVATYVARRRTTPRLS